MNTKSKTLRTAAGIGWLALKVLVIFYALYNAASVTVLYQGF